MKTKKGINLSSAPAAVMILIIVGIVASIGVSINTNIEQSGDSFTSTVANESIVALVNNSYATLAVPRITSLTAIGNTTWNINTTIGLTGNTTLLTNVTASAVNLSYAETSAAAVSFADGNYWVQYNYDNPNLIFSTARNSTLGILQVTSNLDLLGLIIIMGIVIVVLIGAFGGFLGSRGGGL